jgi:signal transduction histidine kinase
VKALEQLQETIRLASQRLRSLLFELRPRELENLGLVPALRAYLEHIKSTEGLIYSIEDHLARDPDPDARAFLYRVAQEILMNVRKHAQASRVDVTVGVVGDCHVVTVRDDGVGFDAARALSARPGHLGLAALNERLELAGGALRVDSRHGSGSTVEFEVPAGNVGH